MVVGDDPAGGLLSEDGNAGGLDQTLNVLTLQGVSTVRGDDERALGCLEEVDGGSDVGCVRMGRAV